MGDVLKHSIACYLIQFTNRLYCFQLQTNYSARQRCTYNEIHVRNKINSFECNEVNKIAYNIFPFLALCLLTLSNGESHNDI